MKDQGDLELAAAFPGAVLEWEGTPGVEITGGPGSGGAMFLTLSFAKTFANYLWSETDHHFTVTRAKGRLTCDPKRL